MKTVQRYIQCKFLKNEIVMNCHSLAIFKFQQYSQDFKIIDTLSEQKNDLFYKNK